MDLHISFAFPRKKKKNIFQCIENISIIYYCCCCRFCCFVLVAKFSFSWFHNYFRFFFAPAASHPSKVKYASARIFDAAQKKFCFFFEN